MLNHRPSSVQGSKSRGGTVRGLEIPTAPDQPTGIEEVLRLSVDTQHAKRLTNANK